MDQSSLPRARAIGRQIRPLLLVGAIGFVAALLGLFPIGEGDPTPVEAQPVSTSTPTPGSLTATPTLPPRVSIVKSCGPHGSSGQFPPGSNLPCVITINLPRPLEGLSLQDIIGGGGRSENTSIVGPALLDGTTSLGSPTPTVDQLNRVVYDFRVGTLSAGTHTISYVWRLSDLGCYRNTTNEVHLNNARGVTLSGGTSTISMLVNCNAPITMGTGTAASCTAAALSDALALAPAPPGTAKLVFDCGAAAHTITTAGLQIGKNLTIDGGGKITLSGGNANRVVDVLAGANVELRGLTIANGKSDTGGGIRNNGGTVVLSDCVIRDNIATATAFPEGGGVSNKAPGTMTIKDCVIRNNQSIGTTAGRGGGVGNTGVMTIEDSTITQNVASRSPLGPRGGEGGGIWVGNGTLTVLDSIVSQNTARFGGGLYIGSAATVKDTTIQGNTATTAGTTADRALGGGIYIANSPTIRASLTIEDSTISQNTAVVSGPGIGQGGGIANDGGATVVVRNSTLTQNTASGGSVGRGGGIVTFNFLGTADVLVEDSFITNNTASGGFFGEGGGIANGGGTTAGGTLTVRNSTLSQNTASGGASGDTTGSGGGIFMLKPPVPSAAVATTLVTNTTITGNTASGTLLGEGGGFLKRGGSATFTNSTVTGNTAASATTARGGGIGSDCPLPTLTATTVTGNTPDNVFPTSCP